MKERQRKLIPWILTALVIGAVVFIVNILSNSGLRDNVERRAFNDLSVSVEAQSAYLHNSWDQHYASLESLAYYIGQLEDFDIKKESDLLNSVAKAQKMCTLGYAGLNGEAVNYDGKYIGNISDREYFIEALSDRDARAISYLETALNSDEEQFVFALPVIRDNDIVGVVFASKEMELFISSFFGDTFNGKGYVFICDNKGNMILSYGEAAEHVPEDNYFAGYTDEMIVSDTSKDEILNSMASGKSGKYIGQHNGKKEYVVFAPLDINDWYIFNIIDVDTANATYENDHRLFSITLLHVVWAFLLMIVWIVVSTIIQQRSIKKEAERYRSQYKITESIFSDMNVAMYKVDLLTGELSITDTFEAMTGYTVPKDLMKSLNVYSASFPDFDFQKGLDLINTVRLEGKVVRYEFDLKTKRGAKKRIELSIHPFYDNKGVIVAIFGLLSDITKEYEERQFNLSLNRVFSEDKGDLIGSYIVNLTSGNVEFSSGYNSKLLEKNAKEYGLQNALNTFIERNVYPEDSENMYDLLDLNRLVSDYEQGYNSYNADYRAIGMGAIRWTNIQIKLSYFPENQSLLAYAIIHDLHKQKLKEIRENNGSTETVEDTDDSTGEEKRVFVRTFGYFDVFVDGEPVHFSNAKEKELFAILIDRNGGTLTASEAISILWEDEPADGKQLARYRKLAMKLKNTLEKYGIEDVINVNKGIRNINVSLVDCDYYRFLDGDPEYVKAFSELYMQNYSWAEDTLSTLINMSK